MDESASTTCVNRAAELRIGGFVPFTTVDFPGYLAAVIFLQGCPWRCPYCQNQHLRLPVGGNPIAWEEIFDRLRKRAGCLEGVVFSGGEPTLQPALADALQVVRGLGFATGLHTAGIFPERLPVLLPLLDWVGLDAKTCPDERYDAVTGCRDSARLFRHSLEIIRRSGVPFTIRTTVDPVLHRDRDIADLQDWLGRQGLPPSILQPVRPLADRAVRRE